MIRLKATHLYMVPADLLAQEAESARAVNMVMLGAFSGSNSFLNTDSVTWAIEETNKKFVVANLNAFWKGYEFVKKERVAG